MQAEALIDFTYETNNNFNIRSVASKNRQHPWLVIKSLPSKKYPVKEGDMLRIGKQKVRVKEIVEKQQDEDEVPENEECTAKGILYCYRTPELEDNEAIHKIWKHFNPVVYKRRCTMSKSIS